MKLTIALTILIGTSTIVYAQYPKIPKDVQDAEDERRRVYEKDEDDAWVKAQPELAAWSKKGKPYIPWAAKPGDVLVWRSRRESVCGDVTRRCGPGLISRSL
jgi:hypothetical protein